MKKYIAILLCVSMLAACFMTGCGFGKKEEETVAETTEEVKSYVIATDNSFKPFEYTNDSGEFVGIDVELLKAIAEDQGFELEIKRLGWDDSINACKNGEADGMMAAVSVTSDRIADGWIFSDGYYNANQTFAVLSSTKMKKLSSLKGKTVVVKNATAGQTYAESLKDEYGYEIMVVNDSHSMYAAVEDGKAIACVEDTPTIESQIKDGSLAMKLVKNSQNEGKDYALAVFSEEQQELIDSFNAGLANIKANGVYAEIIAKYLGE